MELAGALNDFAHGIFPDYHNLNIEELCVILVHSRDRILPELSETLAAYALRKHERARCGIPPGDKVGRCSTRAGDIERRTNCSRDAGVDCRNRSQSPDQDSGSANQRPWGDHVVDSTLAVPDHPAVWALGDCAAVIDSKTKKPCPPTAQFALREAATIARNIGADLEGVPCE